MGTKWAPLTCMLICIFIAACAGARQKFEAFRINSVAEQAAIVQNLKDNMGDYDVYQCRRVAVFDPKNDDKTIIVSDIQCKAFVQQTKDDFIQIDEVTGIRTIVGADAQVFGYITWNSQLTVVRAVPVDARTMRINLYDKPSGAPGRR